MPQAFRAPFLCTNVLRMLFCIESPDELEQGKKPSDPQTQTNCILNKRQILAYADSNAPGIQGAFLMYKCIENVILLREPRHTGADRATKL